ncbi:MAG: DUF2306 domain-containing protein, partial [Chloroflexi bacterium]|nr:DUF2306 domain-containing protein [Chloroflexota bacterium]
RYFLWNPDLFFPQQRAVYLAHDFAIMTHIIGGVLAMALGPFQFLNKLRLKRPGLHRTVGTIYLLGVLAGASGGFYMAFHAFAGMAATLGFAALAAAWLITAVLAYAAIRAGNEAAHRAWMIRNFALTYAGVTLRLWINPLMMAFGEVTGYEIVAWLCWVPNLIVAEAIIRGWLRARRTAGDDLPAQARQRLS